MPKKDLNLVCHSGICVANIRNPVQINCAKGAQLIISMRDKVHNGGNDVASGEAKNP